MTPHATAELPSALVADHCAGSIGDGFAHAGIIGELLEALNAPGRYELVHSDGELFLEPICEA
jgi:hypothetical protein